MAPVDVKTNAATKGSGRKQDVYLNECYLINAGNSQNERYEEDLVPDESGENEKPIVFTEENIAAGVPEELVHVIEHWKK
jgi:thiamine kinase-like enzyme